MQGEEDGADFPAARLLSSIFLNHSQYRYAHIMKKHHESEEEEVSCGYFSKMRGTAKCPPMVSISEIVWSWIGAFLGIAIISGIHYTLLNETALVMVVGSFGASAVLLYGSPKSPFAQPRNLVGGHITSALIGVACFQLFSPTMWLAASLAVATSIVAMHATKTLHPPGGATALIAVIGGAEIHELGYFYALMPAGAGAFIMLLVALAVNNIPRTRSYPKFWV
jgi:CBS-domain-containing membrane protein